MEVRMKKILLAVGAMSLLMTGMAIAEAETPVIDQRQANQEQRIDQGIASGQLNEREANRLNKQQERVNKMEDRAKSDGIMTKKERARIGAAQDRASRHVAREKHDRQGKRHR
jgi:opacity protein-like surface antigen